MSPPKPQTYSSKPVKLDEPENEPDKAAIENGKKFGIGTPEHIERLRKMLQARDAKEEYLGEKILTSSRNLIGKRVTINNPKESCFFGHILYLRIFHKEYMYHFFE